MYDLQKEKDAHREGERESHNRLRIPVHMIKVLSVGV